MKRGEDDVFLWFGLLFYSVRGLPVAVSLAEQLEHASGRPRGPVVVVKEAGEDLAAAHLVEVIRATLEALGNEGDGVVVLAALVGGEAGLKSHQPGERRGPDRVVVAGAALVNWGRALVYLSIPLR